MAIAAGGTMLPGLAGIAQANRPIPRSPTQTQYDLYGSAVGTQAKDYDSIMNNFKSMFDKANAPPSSYNPATTTYNPTAAETDAINNLRDLAKTGGYSDADIANIRERGISPIRSIYASAQRNTDRQRALQGGYSPNYGAIQAKMAREMSDTIANKTTDVNATLAQNIAQNKLSAAPQYSSAAGRESENINAQNQRNAEAQNAASQFNIGQKNLSTENAMKALQGMLSLYGTTPALSSLFGNQALQSASLKNQMDARNQQAGLGMIGNLARLG